MSRELLKEAAQALETVQHYFPAQDEADKGLAVADVGACQKLAERIDTYLAAPSESAMEMVRKIREGATFGHDLSERYCKLLDTEAAALIEDYGRRVPRAMLADIYCLGWTDSRKNRISEDHSAIAAKYGVKMEPPVGKEGEE